MSQQLIDYICSELASGKGPEDIKKALAIAGWPVLNIDEAFTAIASQQTLHTQQSTVSQAPPTPTVATPVAVQQTQAAPTLIQVPTETPQSVKFFEIAMYVSLLAGVISTLFQLQILGGDTGMISSMLPQLIIFLLPFPLIFIFLTWMTARKRKNWARWVLLVFVAWSFIGLFTSLLGLFFSARPSAFLSLIQPILQLIAICYVFSSTANKWFGVTAETVSLLAVPQVATSLTGEGSLTPVLNPTWATRIPRTNIGFLIAYLALVFGLDFGIAKSSPDLFFFWYIMLAVLSLAMVFFALEMFVYKRRFITTASSLDTGIFVVIILRNIIFLLNFIPYIQLIGLVALPTAGIILFIMYVIFVIRRAAGVKSLQKNV